jgi:hypothetical protein
MAYSLNKPLVKQLSAFVLCNQLTALVCSPVSKNNTEMKLVVADTATLKERKNGYKSHAVRRIVSFKKNIIW